MRNFDDWIAAYLEYCSGHEATPRCHMWTAISVLAAALERKVWLPRGYYTLYPNLYVFIVGKSGLIKKSTSTGIGVDMLKDIKTVRVMSDRLTAGSLIDQLQKASKEFRHGQIITKQAPLFAYASELSVFLTEVYGSIIELLTTFYDCIPHDPNKAWTYETKGSGTLKIHGPCLNILGATTKSWLKKCLPNSEMEGGFTSRVLFVVENNPPAKLVAWPEVKPDLALKKEKLVADLRWIHSMVGAFKVTDKARELFTVWYEHHMTSVVPSQTDPRFSGYQGRKGDLLLKLAMVRSVSQRNDLMIDTEDLIWGNEQLEAIEPDMKMAFDGVGLNKYSELVFKVRQYVHRRGLADRMEVVQAFSRDASATEIDRCLQDLLDMREIQWTEREIEGGRKKFFEPLTGAPTR